MPCRNNMHTLFQTASHLAIVTWSIVLIFLFVFRFSSVGYSWCLALNQQFLCVLCTHTLTQSLRKNNQCTILVMMMMMMMYPLWTFPMVTRSVIKLTYLLSSSPSWHGVVEFQFCKLCLNRFWICLWKSDTFEGLWYVEKGGGARRVIGMWVSVSIYLHEEGLGYGRNQGP